MDFGSDAAGTGSNVKKFPCVQIEENSMLGRRMREMGITEGVRICRKRQAPLGDPSVYMVRGSALAIRNMDAAHILVRPVHISVAGGFINRRKER